MGVFNILANWVAIAVIVPLIIAFGWVTVSIVNPQFNVAQWSFTLAASILAVRLIWWIAVEHSLRSYGRGQIGLFSFVVFGAIAALWMVSLSWVDDLRPSAIRPLTPVIGTNDGKSAGDTLLPLAYSLPVGDPVGNLSRLGWAVKRDGKLLQFEISYAPLPNMEQSKMLFEGLREPFRLSFQGVPNLNGLNKVSSVSECKEIQISASELDNVNELRGFVSLKKLSITQVPLNARNDLDISSLQSLTSVETLSLNGSRATTIGPLAAMHHLASLNIGVTLVRDLSPISQLTELKRVDLGGSNVTDLSPLLASKKLEEIGIDGKQAPSLPSLGSLPILRTLRLFDQGNVDLAPIGSLIHLESVFIWGMPSIDLSFMRNLPKLTSVQVNGYPLGVSQVANYSAMCSFGGPKILNLGNLQINSLDFLSDCTNLLELGLNRIPVNSVQGLPNTLKKLSLIDVPVVDISLLLSLANLESLTLLRVPARADVISEMERRGVKVSNP